MLHGEPPAALRLNLAALLLQLVLSLLVLPCCCRWCSGALAHYCLDLHCRRRATAVAALMTLPLQCLPGLVLL